MSTLAIDRSARAREASAPERIATWLLGDAVQLRSGPHEGAVVGWCDAAGRATYVYPEITGYYVRWLAWRHARGDEGNALAARALAAERWLGRWLSSRSTPATRIYLHEDIADWRNGAFFFFDAAMALRGLASVERVGLAKPDRAIVSALVKRLMLLVDSDGVFTACVAADGGSVPARWSTRRGPFLAKAAAGVLDACEAFPVICAPIAVAARATFDASTRWLAETPHDEVHPQLYALEGLLSREEAEGPRSNVRKSFDEIVAATGESGRVPESLRSAGAHRLDVAAQLLRVAALMDASAVGHVELLRTLAQNLAAPVTPSGAIPFDPTAPSPQYNAWVAMFAEQALCVSDPERGPEAVSTLRALLV